MRTISRLVLLSAAVLAASPASAAFLASDRLVELRALLASPVVADFISSAPFNRIEYVEPGLYRVRAGRCHIDVSVVRPPIGPGTSDPSRLDVRRIGRTCER
jgi:hypothetical protein